MIIRLFTILFASISLSAETFMIEDLKEARSDWLPFSDQVMGGESEVNFYEMEEEGRSFYRLEGNVSTKNNGGFIQFRTKASFPNTDFSGIRIKTRGNNEEYFIFIRTPATVLPWNYYSASFRATEDWESIEISFSEFKKSSFILPRKVKSSKIRSIGIVAFGKDHFAQVDVAQVELY